MLHELAHNVHGPHDAKFHALWNQLRDEHEGLVMKGYTGEGFLSEGHRLGGRRGVPREEAQRLARAAAEKRRVLQAGSGQRLGGAPSGQVRTSGASSPTLPSGATALCAAAPTTTIRKTKSSRSQTLPPGTASALALRRTPPMTPPSRRRCGSWCRRTRRPGKATPTYRRLRVTQRGVQAGAEAQASLDTNGLAQQHQRRGRRT